jgi:hypothetical protein
MNNVIMRLVTVAEGYAPLTAVETVGTFTISALPGNAANVFFKGDDGSDVPWVPSEWHIFKHVNLAAILVKGAVGDKVSVVGGTW